jgi:hypothetical protein
MIQFHSHLESSPASAEILSHKIFWFVIVSGGCLFLQQQNYWGPQCNQGPIVAFNLKQADGSWVSYHEVEKLAALSNILFRVSCFQDVPVVQNKLFAKESSRSLLGKILLLG